MMDIKELKVLRENDFSKDKLQKILEKLEEGELEIAYKLTQLLINYINMDFLEKKYNIVKLNDSHMRNIIRLYFEREDNLYRKNMFINDMYLDIAERKLYELDITMLLSRAEDLCCYKKEKYGM